MSENTQNLSNEISSLNKTNDKDEAMSTKESVSMHQKLYDKEIAQTLLKASSSGSDTVLEDISRDRTHSQSLTTACLEKHNASISKMHVGPQHFTILKLIGEGAFGKVMLVRNQLNDGVYAMKVISKKLLKKKNHISYMKSERAILTKVNHPFVVALRFAFQTEKRLFLVMDYLSGGELFFHLRKRGVIKETEVRFYVAEMIAAIEYLHHIGIIHRDLKPENVLLGHDGHVMLTDFGLAKETGNGNNNRTLCGTSEYMAPEMLTRSGYGKAVDWWAIGILMYEMLSGSPPFQAEAQKDLDRKIMQEKLKLPTHASSTAHSLLKGLLEKDMTKRLGAMKSTMFAVGGVAALKKHEFFVGIDFNKLVKKEIPPPIDISEGTLRTDGTNEIGTGNFHEEFTGQQVSQSMIDDAISAGNSQQSSQQTSPSTRSRTGSFDFYENFEYVDSSFSCTEERIKEFEEDLASKLVKLQKKQKHKEKIEMERSIKQKELEAAEKRRKEIKEKLLNDERIAREKKEAAEREKQRVESEIAEYRRVQGKYKEHWLKIEKQREEYRVELDRIQKKLKNLRKKFRDITELEKKKESGGDDMKMTAEQIEKLSKKSEVKSEIESFEQLEKDHLNKPDVSPEIDMTVPKPDEDIEAVINVKYRKNDNNGNTAGISHSDIPSTPSTSSTWRDVTSPEAIIQNQNSSVASNECRNIPETVIENKPPSEGIPPMHPPSSAASDTQVKTSTPKSAWSRGQEAGSGGPSSTSSSSVWGRGNIGTIAMVAGPSLGIPGNSSTTKKDITEGENTATPPPPVSTSTEEDEWEMVPTKKKSPKKR